jgi:hypothetical protein
MKYVFLVFAFLTCSQYMVAQTQSITYFDEEQNRTITIQNVLKIGYQRQYITIEGSGANTRYVSYISNFMDDTGIWSDWYHAMSRPSPNLTRNDLISFFELYSNKAIGTGHTGQIYNMTLVMVLSQPLLHEGHTYWNRETTGFYTHYTVYLKVD